MRRLALACAFALAAATPAAAAVLWFSGAETADVKDFVAVTSFTADGSSAYSGAWGFTAFLDSGQALATTGLAQTTAAFRTRFQWTSQVGLELIWSWYDAGPTKNIRIVIDPTSHKLCWGHNSNTCIATGTTALTVSTWYLIECKCVIDAAVGGCEIKVDGNTEFTSFGTNTSDLVAIDRGYLGPQLSLGGANFLYDDVMICGGAYCPEGRTIARQGITGTPTYNAWTKNGAGACAGGDISVCWSDTPADPSRNATSGTASDAQTMRVHAFNTPQAGHGTEIIHPNATINACTTAMMAKTASGTPAISIRRRLAGSDTDTAKTLTSTSDLYYDDGVWTTAAVNLSVGTPEIGVVHGAGVITEQVEDMWLICDYSGGTPGAVKHRVTIQ